MRAAAAAMAGYWVDRWGWSEKGGVSGFEYSLAFMVFWLENVLALLRVCYGVLRALSQGTFFFLSIKGNTNGTNTFFLENFVIFFFMSIQSLKNHINVSCFHFSCMYSYPFSLKS